MTFGSAQTLAHADPDLVGLLADLFAEVSGGDDVRAIEDRQELSGRMVETVIGAGLPDVGIPEEVGGQGGTHADAAAVLYAAGRSAAPYPFAEQGLTGGWLLACAGIGLPDGPFVTAVDADLTTAGDRVTGSVTRVPWLRQFTRVVALADGGAHVVVFALDGQRIEQGSCLAGEPRDSVEDIDAAVMAVAPAGVAKQAELEARAAATRVLLLAGACEAMLTQAVHYAAEREQFGRPINTFQAVATHLALIAEETAMASAAADMVTAALGTSRLRDEVAVAKIVAGESGSAVARAAHQVFGAMGVTAECDLQLFSRRIWTWRDEHGSEAAWSRALGERVLSAGPDGAWDVICEPIGGTP